MPALTISTDFYDAKARTSDPASPTRPPMSPITPVQEPSNPPAGQEQPPILNLTHNTHPERVPTVPVPPPRPFDFEDNVDVIALKSTISMLQMQSRRADSDIKTLRDVKQEALNKPEEFVQHLVSSQERQHVARQDGHQSSPSKFQELPNRIDIARCPPINWSKYAVAGDALDKLHDEQVKRPVQGSPAVFTNGVYEFKGGEGKQEDYQGPTAPYDPLTEKVGKKPKSKK